MNKLFLWMAVVMVFYAGCVSLKSPSVPFYISIMCFLSYGLLLVSAVSIIGRDER